MDKTCLLIPVELVQALESYASHLESTFVQIKLPPSSPNATISPTFDLSSTFVTALDAEFTRVYEEYMHRIGVVRVLSEEIIKLWAELGTPQAQIDGAIIENLRDAPEQLGLHQVDLNHLQARRDRLLEEKRGREKRLKELKSIVEGLWAKLGVEENEQKSFLSSNRGCSLRTINEFQSESVRLNELKKQNLHLFVEEARLKLQDLWDALYFSEEEMLEFTAAFQGKYHGIDCLMLSALKICVDVYNDALLYEHEMEIERLESLRDQRSPTLALIERYRSLVKDRYDLSASSQDASRLMLRGTKGERRDPTRLLREEKMRKRIAKELPKVEAELRKALQQWEDEYGRPFLVHGQRYLDELGASSTQAAQSRAKTPLGVHQPTANRTATKSAPRSGTVSGPGVARAGPALPRSKTPSSLATTSRAPTLNNSSKATSSLRSPSKIPARIPLTTSTYGNRSPERAPSTKLGGAIRLAPPPKMKSLMAPPPPPPTNRQYHNDAFVRNTELEDVYDDIRRDGSHRDLSHQISDLASTGHSDNVSLYSSISELRATSVIRPDSRQISQSSVVSSEMISGSENWETYEDGSDVEPEIEAQVAYQAKLNTSMKREIPNDGYINQDKIIKKARAGEVYGFDYNSNSGRLDGDDEWIDEDVD